MWRKKSHKNKQKRSPPNPCTLLKMDILEKTSELTGTAGS